MADKTLASLTAATPATGGLLYGIQGGADRKFTLSAAGAALMEAADTLKLDELAAPTDVTTLNATTSAHGLLPKLSGGTTNFLRADGAWAAPTGGGEVNFYGQAWVDLVSGNNGSAAIGKPSLPFQTLQAAYNSGARIIHLGFGSFGDLTIDGNIQLSLIGVGLNKTIIGNVYSSSDFSGSCEIRGNGNDNITVTNILLAAFTGAPGVNAAGAEGGNLGHVYLSGLHILGNASVKGGTGGGGDKGFDIGEYTSPGGGYAGGSGGNAAIVHLNDCNIVGNAISAGGDGGSGGQGGNSTDATWSGGNGGNGGNGGQPGQIIMERCAIQGYADCPSGAAGSAGSGGSGGSSGFAGADGTPGDVGNVGSEWSTIVNASVTATTGYRTSLVGGTWVS